MRGEQEIIPNISERDVLVSFFGEKLVATKKADVLVSFHAFNPLELQNGTIKEEAGDGVVTHEAPLVLITSSTGSANLRSRDTLRYVPGHGAGALFTARMTGSGEAEVGLVDDENGMFFKVSNGVLSVGYRDNSIDTVVTRNSFNGNSGIEELDFSRLNVFFISFGYLGIANPAFYAMNKYGNFIKIHEFYTAGQLTGTHTGDPVLPIRMKASGDMEIASGSWCAFTFGEVPE